MNADRQIEDSVSDAAAEAKEENGSQLQSRWNED